MKIKCFLGSVLAAGMLLSSCGAPNVAYFNDLSAGSVVPTSEQLAIRLMPQDKITIVVNNRSQELSTMFNLPIYSLRLGGTSSYSQYMAGYTVDSEGYIDFPQLGRIKVAGLKREEVAYTIKDLLVESNLLKDPVVTVEYANLGFNIMGEVNKPGRYAFDRDRLTILDALAMAGDLSIQGKRQNILLMREQKSGNHITYRLDLQNAQQLMQSPAFYIQQNDVIYVEPNAYRARQTTVNGNNVLSASFWISVASLATSITTSIVTILNRTSK